MEIHTWPKDDCMFIEKGFAVKEKHGDGKHQLLPTRRQFSRLSVCCLLPETSSGGTGYPFQEVYNEEKQVKAELGLFIV